MRNNIYIICLSFLFIISIISLTISIIAFIKNKREYLDKETKFDLLSESKTLDSESAKNTLNMLEKDIDSDIEEKVEEGITKLEEEIAIAGLIEAVSKQKEEQNVVKQEEMYKLIRELALQTRMKYLSQIRDKGPPGTIMI